MESSTLGLILMGVGMMMMAIPLLNYLVRKSISKITPLQIVWYYRKNVPDMMGDPELSDLVNECLLFMHNELFKSRMARCSGSKKHSVSTDPHEMLEIEAELMEGDYFPNGVELNNYMMLFVQYQNEQFQKGRITKDLLEKYRSLYERLTKLGLDLLNPKQQ